MPTRLRVVTAEAPSSNEDGCTATAPERAPYYNERWGRYYETHACVRALQQENFLLPVRLIINVEKQADARGLGDCFSWTPGRQVRVRSAAVTVLRGLR